MDQVLVYFLMLTGLILLLLQVILFALTLIVHPVAAASYVDVLSAPSVLPDGPAHDLAFMVLDQVFGVKGIFNSCVATDIACKDAQGNDIIDSGVFPYPAHTALHNLLGFYSTGLLMIGVIMILYFVITIVGETATSGTPFGQRYNKAWVPVRIVLFFALLVPLNFNNAPGLNGGQFVTLQAAKWGSNMASNAWVHFNAVLSTSYLGDTQNLIAAPNVPETAGLNQFFFVARLCDIAQSRGREVDVQAYGHSSGPLLFKLPFVSHQ